VDVLPALECVDTKPSDQSLIPHMDLDNSEISLDIGACVSLSTDSPKSEGISFPLTVCILPVNKPHRMCCC